MKEIRIRILTLMTLILFSMSCIAQDGTQQLEKIGGLYRIIDTLSKDNTSITMQISWMDSVVEIRKTVSLKYDLQYQRKFRRDSTYIPTSLDIIRYNELRRIGSQNCHSYALEKYFNYHNVMDNELFTNMTIVTENKYMDKILVTTFKKVAEITTRPKKNLKYNFGRGTILVFRNKWNTPIHTVFYDGEFHSKYGGWGAKAEKELKPIFDKYWDTTIIEEFQIDLEKVNRYLNKGTD